MTCPDDLIKEFSEGEITYPQYMMEVGEELGSTPWISPSSIEKEQLINYAEESQPEYVVLVGPNPEIYEQLTDHAQNVVATDRYNVVLNDVGTGVQTDFVDALGDNSVEMIYAINSLQSVEEPLKKLEDACRILKPGGRLIATVPNEDSAQLFPTIPASEDDLEPPRIKTGLVNGGSFEQHYFPEDWIDNAMREIEWEAEIHKGEVLADIRGMPYILDAIAEDDRPEIPQYIEESLRKKPDETLLAYMQSEGLSPDKIGGSIGDLEPSIENLDPEELTLPRMREWVIEVGT